MSRLHAVHDPAPRRVRLVVHGACCQSPGLRRAVRRMRGGGTEVEVRVTFESGDGHRFTREAVDSGCDAVVAMGGDGTLNEVVNGLCDAGVDARRGAGESGAPRVGFGVVPGGTGNDFARAADLVEAEPTDALRWVTRGVRRRIDLVRVTIEQGPEREERLVRRLLNVSTVGLGAEVTARAPERAKRWLGNFAYLISGIQHLRDLEAAQVELTGDVEWRGPAYGLVVGNARQAGGGVRLCPRAKIDDGLLDLVIFPEVPLDELVPIMGETLLRGDFVEGTSVVYHQTRSLVMRFAEPTRLNLDGEPLRGTTFRFEIEPGRLEAFLPPSDLVD